MSKKVTKRSFDPKLYEKPDVNAEKVNEIKEAFDLFDEDGSGQISTEELRGVIESLNVDLGGINIKDLMHTLDRNENGEIDFDEFIGAMTISSGEAGSEEEIQKVNY